MEETKVKPFTPTFDEYMSRAINRNTECIQQGVKIITFFNKLMDDAHAANIEHEYGYYYGIITKELTEMNLLAEKDNSMAKDPQLIRERSKEEANRVQEALAKAGLLPNRTVDDRIFAMIQDDHGYAAVMYVTIMLLDYYWATLETVEKIEAYKPTNCDVPSKETLDDIKVTLREVSGLLEHIFEKMVY